MGGQLALALAQLRPRQLAGLVLLATPWDFHAEKPADRAGGRDRRGTPWLPLLDHLGGMPVDMLQGLFAALDPFLVVRKFCAFARLDPASDRAREFVALEDWLNDGVPLAAAVARECLLGWYGENTPGRGAWRVAGQAIASGGRGSPGPGRRPGAGPHRAAAVGAGAGERTAGRHGAEAVVRPYRHGVEQPRAEGAVAAAHSVAGGLPCHGQSRRPIN